MSEEINVVMDTGGVVGDDGGTEVQEKSRDSLRPMYMQLFSAWDVRKAPVNCIPRLCTLQVTRLDVKRPLEAGLASLVLAVSMKTPHRFLRSSEISVSASGTLTVPLDLTFSLQYPHFLKRGGNVLQIRLQRRKRVRNRPLGGYKNLAIGYVEMSQVLQHSFQGEVKLYAEKVQEHMAVVNVSFLTTTAIDLDRGGDHDVSSEDEDEDMLFEYHIGSDTESGDNEQPSYESKKKFKPSTSAVLRLLHLYRSPKSRHHHHSHRPIDPNVLMLEEEEEFHASSVAFASSPSETEDEEEEEEEAGTLGVAPARPTLSPFFGSDRCSLVSLPTTAKSAESWIRAERLDTSSPSAPESPKGVHQVEIPQTTAENSPPVMFSVGPNLMEKDWELSKERIWCVEAGLPTSSVVGVGLAGEGEVVVEVDGSEEAISNIGSICNCVNQKWQQTSPFCVVLVGSDGLVSNAVQALCRSSCPPQKIRFALIPVAPGLMSARLSSLDEKYRETFPVEGQWLSGLQDGAEFLVKYICNPLHSLPLPLAQVSLQKVSADKQEQSLPFMCSVSVGSWDEPDLSCLPLPPTSPPLHTTSMNVASTGAAAASPSSASGIEAAEFVLEYTTLKGVKEKVKVRSAHVSYVESMLNVTALKDKKGKSILKRKTDGPGGSIISLNVSHMTCRPKGEGLVMAVVVDGVQIEGVGLIKLQANWDQTSNNTFSIAVQGTMS